MSLLKIKGGVIVSRQVIIAAAVVNAANSLGLTADMVITSGRDGTHMPESKHYRDQALDFRTRTLKPPMLDALVAETQRRLGPDYDVVLEADHLHVEYDR